MEMNNNSANRSCDPFIRRCRLRIGAGILAVLLGAAASGTAMAGIYEAFPLLCPEPQARSFLFCFYQGTGIGLILAGILQIVRNRSFLKNPKRMKKRKIREMDERVRTIGTRSWAYAGYSLFLLLYAGILVSGFVSITAVRLLLCVMAAFAALLGIWRVILGQKM